FFGFGSLGGWVQQQGHAMSGGVAGDDYGAALALGDFRNSGTQQLAVGAPGRNGSGRVEVLGWVGSGASGFFALYQTLDQTMVSGQTNQSGDKFGSALRVMKLHGGSHEDLAVGAPGKSSSAGQGRPG